jgi:hypothetical protein
MTTKDEYDDGPCIPIAIPILAQLALILMKVAGVGDATNVPWVIVIAPVLVLVMIFVCSIIEDLTQPDN